MFESVTKKRKNPIFNFFGWALLTVVCVVFIFVGFSPNSMGLGQGGAAAHVNGDAISRRDFKELLDRLDDNKQAGAQQDRRRMQENAINILVSQSLIVQEAAKLNVFVSDAEVGQALIDIDFFYEDGIFSRVRYKNFLKNSRLTESEFEDKLRRDLIIRKMSQLIGFAAKDLDIVDDFDEKIEQAQINVAYVKLSPDALPKIGDADLSSYISKNKEAIQKYFDSHKSEFTTAEQVKARHILVKAKDDKKESMDVARAKAEKIAKDVTVANFSEKAKKLSDDPGSKTRGGDLGFFGRGRMVPEFEKVAFSSPVGKVSEIVESKFGYHLILVDEKKPATEKKLEEVENQIAKQLKSKGQFEELSGNFKDLLRAKKYGEMETLVTEKGLTWKDTGFFNITKENIPGIGPHKEFLDAAMEVGPENEYLSRLVYKGDQAFVIKFKGAQLDKSPRPQNQMDFFKQLMRQQRMNSMVQSWADSLRAKASVSINSDLLQ